MFAKYAQNGITFSSAYVERSKEIPTAPWGVVFGDSRTESWDKRAVLDLKLLRELSSETDLTARVTYGWYEYDGDYAYGDEVSGDITINKDVMVGQWGGVDIQVVHPFGRHMIIAGMEYRNNLSLDQKNFDDGGVTYLNDHRSTQNWGLFVQDEYPLSPSFSINAGLRYDEFSTFGSTLNPRIALIFRPSPNTSIKYLAGKAFRAPNPYELFYNDGDIRQKANPDLDEEKLTSHELVWEQLIGTHILGTVSLYHHDIYDLISQGVDDDGLLFFVNQENVSANGVEFEVAAVSSDGFSAGMSYAYQESEYTDSNKVFTNSPNHLAKFNISAPLIPDRMFLTLEEQYVGRLLTLAGDEAGDYFLTNLTLYCPEVFKHFDFSGSVYNLFNHGYYFPGSDEHLQDRIRQDGISFRAKLVYRF
jgi:outer membrane receptor for ferrienterochelin and colicins